LPGGHVDLKSNCYQVLGVGPHKFIVQHTSRVKEKICERHKDKKKPKNQQIILRANNQQFLVLTEINNG
jgi:hypothetical protein